MVTTSIGDLEGVIRGRQLGRNEEGRRLREQAGIGLRELARVLDVPVGVLSRWERGVMRPRPEKAIRWASVMDVISRTLDEARR